MVLFVVSAVGISAAEKNVTTGKEGIRLVVQITVDGLRADLLDRYHHGLSEDGFLRLIRSGVIYKNAHYRHANTETIVGHTTLSTGTVPAVHGMTGNAWFDAASGELAYNIEDPDFPPLPTREQATAGTQVDPSQQLARTDGRSPRAILAETLADRLVAYSGGRAKVFAISGKDRSAVAMAGQVGKAFWISTDTGDFITSRYYYDEYPSWAVAWNEERQVEKLADTKWELSRPASEYVLSHQDDRPYESDLRGFGRTFPKQFPSADSPLLPTLAIVSPFGDEITLDFAKAALRAEDLGDDHITDYLSISFSGVDAVNHFFGPSSLENEETVLRIDETLADLLEFLDREVGLEHTLVVLSADHGMAEIPEYLASLGFPADRLYTDEVVEASNDASERLFGISDISRFFFRPYLYLDHEKIAAAGLDATDVRTQLALALETHPGVRVARTRDAITHPATDAVSVRLRNNFHPDRSGDIYIVQSPGWFNFEKGMIVTMHGSPWRYDTHVPIIFSGGGIRNASAEYRLVHPADVAPTIAALLGMSGPAAADGRVLEEVMQARH